MKSLRSLTVRKGLTKPSSHRRGAMPQTRAGTDPNVPSIAPMWIIGPSGPTGSPDPTASKQLMNLARKTVRVKVLGMMIPLRKDMVSGMPEPAALGSKKTMMEELRSTIAAEVGARQNHPQSSQPLSCVMSLLWLSASVAMGSTESMSTARERKITPMLSFSRKAVTPQAKPMKPFIAQRRKLVEGSGDPSRCLWWSPSKWTPRTLGR
mmetsp:Transcript_755/g.2427  ORF Transcript_755/g.2427 Transcript_755/m.2427 type:complete len:208 (-) Transcript_755:371-994(-)